MKRRTRGFFPWLMIRLSSFYRHVLTVIIFALGYLLLGWVVFSHYSHDLKLIELEKKGLHYEAHLRELILSIYTHKNLVQRYHLGNEGLKNQILNIQAAANEDLWLMDKNQGILKELAENNEDRKLAPLPSSFKPTEIEKGWKEIRARAFQLSVPESQELHDNLVLQIQGLKQYVGSLTYLTQDTEKSLFELVDTSAKFLPEVQKQIEKILNRVSTIGANGELTEKDRNELIGRLAVLENYTDQINDMVPTALMLLANQPGMRDPLTEVYGTFSQAMDQFIHEVKALLRAGSLKSQIEGAGIRALNETFVLWDSGDKILLEFLDVHEAEIRFERLIVAGVSLFILLVGFFIGAYFVTEAQKSLKALKDTAIKISRGDLSARVPLRHRDEMGKVCVVFNHMASTLERMMNQFHFLIQGTQKLARGDFSVRLQVDPDGQDEIAAVGEAFNRMAESFEEVVSRLHRLGIDLTSSATQISAASKQHEATLAEQGTTTKQISITATEISATAKDFALTISEVGDVADETARLARMGQSSLVRMEKAMNKMEEAAANITSRLADLNQKAGNITGVITTISDVSAQTNLLSLNAAIEAEKAGQAGRSFAVIAREIRGLSNQTAMSTLDIEKIVNEIVEAVKSSVMGVDDFTQEIRDGAHKVNEVSEQLSQIMEQVKSLVERFDTVDQGMKNQSDAAEQINKALLGLSEMANETNLSMKHFHSTISHLDRAAADLRETLEKLR